MVGAVLGNRSVSVAREHGWQFLELVGLSRFADKPACSMTISEQRRLAVARSLAIKPRLLLMDEVMAGLNPSEVKEMVDTVKKIRNQGISCLIVEHVLEGIMPIADKIVVLDYGRKIAEGPPQVVSNDPVVISAYLGDE
jgi:branched-chain amino acid transport system ATP-binding protein